MCSQDKWKQTQTELAYAQNSCRVSLYCCRQVIYGFALAMTVHYLSCQAVRRTAYLNFCGSRMLKGLGLGTMALASKVQALALALALRDEALALRFWP